MPVVSAIIPHLKGDEILLRCLRALTSCTYSPLEIILVDNASTDGSSGSAASLYPQVRLVRSTTNLGYAGGCNLGLSHAAGKYALLLNDDAEVTPGFLGPLVACMESDSSIGACQPKILSIAHPERFDYAGAAGGYLDRFGYPFCRGRIFATSEEDSGQYDDPAQIFWASGACCLIRMSALEETGRLDEDFFAHMEEIDLQWRMRKVGYRVMSVPASVVHHEAGSTLGQENPHKVYLNHRNNLIMLVKNLGPLSLLEVLPVRLILDMVAAFYRLIRGEPLNALAVFRSFFSIPFFLPRVLRKRSRLNRRGKRKVDTSGTLYRRSIVWDYYVRKRMTFSSLPVRRGEKPGHA